MKHQASTPALMISLALLLSACNDKSPSAVQGPTEGTAQAPAQNAAPSAGVPTVSVWEGDLASHEASKLCALDSVNGRSHSNGQFDVPAGEAITFEGWAATGSLDVPATVTIVMKGEKPLQVSGALDQARDDVARAYSSERLVRSGFKVSIPSGSVPQGRYELLIVHADAGRQVACATSAALNIQ